MPPLRLQAVGLAKESQEAGETLSDKERIAALAQALLRCGTAAGVDVASLMALGTV